MGCARRMKSAREIIYLSPAAPVSMGNQWFDIARLEHFWIRRRFQVLQRLAGDFSAHARKIAEVGCGHGLLQRQIEDAYGQEVVGFDLNEEGLRQNVSRLSPVYCYDIFDQRSELQQRFDVIFLFDVLEHITDEHSFLNALLFHLAPGGRVVVNVPAGQWVYSVYDRAVGHVRRYSIRTLRQAADSAGLRVVKWTYWGLPLIPSLVVRKLWLKGKHVENEIISAGLDSRNHFIDQIMGMLAGCEPIPQKLIGTSLMAVLEVGRG
jgi:SAM-dependent methyltransferase